MLLLQKQNGILQMTEMRLRQPEIARVEQQPKLARKEIEFALPLSCGSLVRLLNGRIVPLFQTILGVFRRVRDREFC